MSYDYLIPTCGYVSFFKATIKNFKKKKQCFSFFILDSFSYVYDYVNIYVQAHLNAFKIVATMQILIGQFESKISGSHFFFLKFVLLENLQVSCLDQDHSTYLNLIFLFFFYFFQLQLGWQLQSFEKMLSFKKISLIWLSNLF